MATLQLYFLGPLDVRSGGEPLPRPPTLKSQSLLAYLVYHRGLPQARDQLAGLFFCERDERRARRSLSTALWHIHRCLPGDYALSNDSQTVQFDPRLPLWLDVEEFESLAAKDDAASLHAAVALYRGDFLEGFYDDWIISERYRLESLYLDTLARLMAAYAAARDHPSALVAALRLLGRDALREDAYQAAMRAYCRLGQRKEALELYARCRDTLRKELDTQPVVETEALYQAILKGALETGPARWAPPSGIPPAPVPAAPAGHDPLDVTLAVPMVGRERETAFLEDCWRAAQAGRTWLALVSGEVGVGKTRLVETFANRLRWQGIRVLWGRCYAFERALPYQPITDALRALLFSDAGRALEGLPAWAQREVARLAPELLESPGERGGENHPNAAADPAAKMPPEIPPEPGTNPEQARLFAGVARFLAELSGQGPLLLVLEDLHWASESTLKLLHHLTRWLSGQRVLVVGTFRPEEAVLHHPLRPLYAQLARDGLARLLELSPLSAEAVQTIVIEMSGAGEAAAPLAERLYRETEGNPFFLMESIKALFEAGTIHMQAGAWQADFARISAGEVPLSRSASEAVQARVDRLGQDAQDGLRLAAVLGREFNDELLHAAWGRGEEAALEMLDELLRHRLIEEKVGPGDNDFAFTHHLIQEVIYQGLPRHRRLHLHARVGAAMETLYAAELDQRAAELAHHFEQAYRIDKSLCGRAVTYLLKAGKQAARQFANQEAEAYYQRGLDLIRTQPESVERARREVELLLAQAAPINAMKGYASAEARGVYGRAYDLCQALGETPEMFRSLLGLARYYGITGDPETGSKLGERMLSIAQSTGDPDQFVQACRELGGDLTAMGRLQEARAYWERGLALYDPQRYARYAYLSVHDPGITFMAYLSLTLWLLGYPEQALVQNQSLGRLVETFTHPLNQAVGYCHLAHLACVRHAPQAVCDHAGAALYHSQMHGLRCWTALATALKGWGLVEVGQAAEGLTLLQGGIQAWQSTGFQHLTSFLLALQAQACLKVGRLEDAMEALAAAQRGGDRYWQAEIYRLQGELLREGGADGGTVETSFRQAAEIARQQGARILELRAALSLARLWKSQGRAPEARQALAEAYAQFSEGFDTRDLQSAGELLRQLDAVPA